MINKKWEKIIETLDFAFQPIIDINTKEIYGVEVLLRNYEEVGFDAISKVFDRAYEENILFDVDLLLIQKAIEKFKEITFYREIKFFYNLDNRVLAMENFSISKLEQLLNKNSISKESINFELNEKKYNNNIANLANMLEIYSERDFQIATDNFSTIFSNVYKLFETKINIFKISPFFIRGISSDKKKEKFVKGMIEIMYSLGVKVIAQGVETVEEFNMIKKLGCSMIQGYYLAYPTTDINKIKEKYEIESYINKDFKINHEIVEKNIEENLFVYETESIEGILKILKKNKGLQFITVLNTAEKPIGIIRESEIKNYLLSPFGQELLKKKELKELYQNIKVYDTDIEMSKIVEELEDDFVFITENNKYKGFLRKEIILELMKEIYA